MISDEYKALIDSMSYEHMLRLWRFSPIGDPLFQGEIGEYFSSVMKDKMTRLSVDDQACASKCVGWSP